MANITNLDLYLTKAVDQFDFHTVLSALAKLALVKADEISKETGDSEDTDAVSLGNLHYKLAELASKNRKI